MPPTARQSRNFQKPMRLAQLARKIAVKPADIVSFLASQNIQIDEGSNAKVADEYERLVLQHFAPELLASQPEAEINVESLQPAEEQVEIPNDNVEAVDTEVVTPEPEEVKEEEKPDVIKPPKVELPGLKVVGKIDLPEPKKKTPEPETQVSAEATPLEGDQPVAPPDGDQPTKPVGDTRAQQRDRRRPHHDRRQRDEQRPRKNPIALQREREEREALRKKMEDQKIQKELRTQRYLKKVEGKTPAQRPSKKAKKKHEDEYEVYTEKPQPKSLFGRIMNWFVSE